MSLKATFKEHKDAVVGLACVKEEDAQHHWLLSTGWDRRIYIWNLNTLELHDVFRNNASSIKSGEELAADGIILGIDYSPERKEFGYCSADKMAYIRKFSRNGNQMKLIAVLQGHEAEVTQV
jgi:WD40 repeat protein